MTTTPLSSQMSRIRWLVPLCEFPGITRDTGGIGTQFAALLPRLAELGVDVTLLILPDSQVVQNPTGPMGPDVVIGRRYGWLPSGLRSIPRAVDVRRVARAGRFDVVFAPEWRGIAAFVEQLPVVTNLVTGVELFADKDANTTPLRRVRRRLRVLVQGVLERTQIERSAGIVACSSAVLDWYEARFSLPPVREVVPNCIDVDSLKRASSGVGGDIEGWPESPLVILHAGRVQSIKGAEQTLAAFNTVALERRDVSLVLAGRVVHEGGVAAYEKLVQPDVKSRVKFIGHVEPEELHAAMGRATFCVMPSLWESFGNVALEAKGAGAPVIVTSGTGFVDFCADGVDSIVVPPGDADALANGMRLLLEDEPLRGRLASRGSEQVWEFDARRVAPRLVAAVHRAMRGKSSMRDLPANPPTERD